MRAAARLTEFPTIHRGTVISAGLHQADDPPRRVAGLAIAEPDC